MFIYVNFSDLKIRGNGVCLRGHSSALADGMTQLNELFETLLPLRFRIAACCHSACSHRQLTAF